MGRIAQACQAAGRDPASVGPLAISKTFGADAVLRQWLPASAFGENYIQEGVDKIAAVRAALPGAARCSGTALAPSEQQDAPVAEHFDWVHTVDRLKIAERLSAQRPDHLPPLKICIQVNMTEAPTSRAWPRPRPWTWCALSKLPRLVVPGADEHSRPCPEFEAQLAIPTGAPNGVTV